MLLRSYMKDFVDQGANGMFCILQCSHSVCSLNRNPDPPMLISHKARPRTCNCARLSKLFIYA